MRTASLEAGIENHSSTLASIRTQLHGSFRYAVLEKVAERRERRQHASWGRSCSRYRQSQPCRSEDCLNRCYQRADGECPLALVESFSVKLDFHTEVLAWTQTGHGQVVT